MFLRARVARIIVRQNSSLAEKLRRASSGQLSLEKAQQLYDDKAQLDASGEQFREPFLAPKRKLRGQIQIEQATGRTALVQRSRFDIHDKLSVRRDRSSEISPDSEWSDVWPAARTFNASVVPLPVRMGSRRDPDKRAPFKKHGNLELVKIPNFLHLTPAAIQKHCEAIKKFCTEYPKELVEDKQLLKKQFPISVSYNSYVHQGTNIRDNRSRVVTVTVPVSSLNLSSQEKEKLVRLSGQRYNEETDILTIITDRCHTRQQNLDYANYLLTALYHESKKVEVWEKMKSRGDNMKVEFEGSPCQEKIIHAIQKTLENSMNSSVQNVGSNASKEQISSHERVQKFGEMYNKYRNEKETADSTREYAKQIRELLGISNFEKKSSTA